MTKQVVLFACGHGALSSARYALERVGVDVTVTTDFDTALEADGLVLLGSGTFAAATAALRTARGARIVGRRLAGNRPVFGIGAGMQLLFDRSEETEHESEGLAEWPGAVARLRAPIVPHLGWNIVEIGGGSRLFAGIAADSRFYFAHSYAAHEWSLEVFAPFPEPVVSWADHDGQRFVTAVENGPLTATQFHPEKSGDAGLTLIENWVRAL